MKLKCDVMFLISGVPPARLYHTYINSLSRNKNWLKSCHINFLRFFLPFVFSILFCICGFFLFHFHLIPVTNDLLGYWQCNYDIQKPWLFIYIAFAFEWRWNSRNWKVLIKRKLIARGIQTDEPWKFDQNNFCDFFTHAVKMHKSILFLVNILIYYSKIRHSQFMECAAQQKYIFIQ